MDDNFQLIKNNLSILKYTEIQGSQLKKNFINPCPICGHHDCFSVDEQTRLWKCFSCDKGGSIIDLIMNIESCDNKQALQIGADITNISLNKSYFNSKKPKTESQREALYRETADVYHDSFMKNGGHDYFINSRKHKIETARKMRVGWSTGSLIKHFKKSYSSEDILKYGLASKKDDKVIDYFFAGQAIFPIIGFDGEILSFTSKNPKPAGKDLLLQGNPKEWFLNHQAISKYSEIIIVEGQHDIASLFDIGIFNVIGTIGQPAEKQLQLLRNHCTKKHLYIWMDQDDAGIRHTRKISKVLKEQEYNVKVICHPKGKGKDPDDFIQALRDSNSPAKKIIQNLKDSALSPLEWEITLIAELPTLAEKKKELDGKEIWKKVAALPDIEQEIYIEKIEVLGFAKKSIQRILDLQAELLDDIKTYIFDCTSAKQKPNGKIIAEKIWKWFTYPADDPKGRFFKTTDKSVCLFYRHCIYDLSDNLDFQTLLDKLTELSTIKDPGKEVLYFLRTMCNERAELIEIVSWLYTDVEKDNIFVNLNSLKNTILRISPNKVEEIPNGINKFGVLLSSSENIKPFNYLPDQDIQEGLALLQELIRENLSCAREMQYFVVCWIMFIFLMDYNKDRCLLKCTGQQTHGKSTAAVLLTALIYKQTDVGQSSAPSSISEASENPLVVQDNLENRDLTKAIINFLLLCANSAVKKKRKQGQDRGIVKERMKTMCIITAIESFPGRLPELISRTFEIVFESKYFKDGFSQDEIIRKIYKKRDNILSAIIKMIAHDVLPNFSNRIQWRIWLDKEHPKHDKKRMNDFLTSMTILLESYLKYMPHYPASVGSENPRPSEQAHDILEKWIIYQDSQAHEIAMTSNSILVLLDGIAKKVNADMKKEDLTPTFNNDYPGKSVLVYFHPEYLTEFIKLVVDEPDGSCPENLTTQISYLEFVVTGAELNAVINRYCKDVGTRNPFDNPSALGARIKESKNILQAAGWSIPYKENLDPYWKKSGGQRYWKFSKQIN